MDKRNVILKVVSTTFICLLLAMGTRAADPIKTLLITGQNNHNWTVSHQVIKKIYENSGLFKVDFAISPQKGGDMESFNPNFSNYDLVVLDYNGDSWNKNTQDAFIEYVKNGGGVVVYHAANNAFSTWEEYNKITALGGWESRNEKSGDWVYLKDGKLFRDSSPGNGGSHRRQHKFMLTKRNDTHPIVKGMPQEWMHDTDELYDRMRGPGNIKDLLFSAYSEASTGGSSREEPLVFTVDYGKGRIFHNMLGHAGATIEDSPAMQCTGFQVLMLRGGEWAATGKVKQKMPDDFPSKNDIKIRKDYK